MNKLAISALVALGLLAAPAIASAETAYTNAAVNLRAGPDAGYPRIATLRAGQRVEIHGCINDWSWCDISVGRERGWVSAGYLGSDYRGRRVAVSGYGTQMGLPVLGFVLGTYWDSHYRGRSWYSQRSHWEQHPPANTRKNSRPQQGASNRPSQPQQHDRPQQSQSQPQKQVQPKQARRPQDDKKPRP